MIKQVFILSILLSACTQQKLRGPYLGQHLPESAAELFAPGIVNDGISTRDITFTPDGKELYFCKNTGNSTYSTIFFCKETEKGWTDPDVVWFARNPEFIYIEPFISPDGQKLFFVSNKGNSFTNRNRFITDIWVSERKQNNWGEPYKLDSTINTPDSEFFPSISENENLYFTRENSKTREGFIYKAKWENGSYLKPEKLPEQINAGVARFNACISSDESFIIIPTFGMPDSYGASDYYISFFDKEKGWSTAQNMGTEINSDSALEYSANFSPDGKFLFFMSSKVNAKNLNKLSTKEFKRLHNEPENGNSNIYWIKSDFINNLKEKATFTENKQQ